MPDVETFLAIGADLSADPATWSFTDVTPKIREAQKVRIDCGRRGRLGQVQTTRVSATADNTDGNLARHNPLGSNFGLLRRNTPMRTDIDGVTRATTFVTGFPPAWDASEQDQTVTLVGVGILDRINRWRTLRPAVHQAMLGSLPLGMWPLDDPAGSTSAASAVSGVNPMTTVDAVGWAEIAGVAGTSASLADLDQATLSGALPTNVGSGWAMEFLARPTSSAVDGYMVQVSTDTATFSVVPDLLGIPTGVLIQANGSTTIYAPAVDPDWVDTWHHYVVKVSQGVGLIDVELWYDGVLVTSSSTGLVTNPGRPQGVRINPHFGASTFTRLNMAFGYVGVYGDPDTVDVASHYQATLGYAGELAHERITRLCAENGIRLTCAATVSAAMGVQPAGSLRGTLQAAADADGGVLAESTDWGLLYLSLDERTNVSSPAIELNYAAGEIAPPWEPTDDAQQFYNDVTASRSGGTTYRAADEESIAEVGVYDTAIQPNVYGDNQVAQAAGWALHLGLNDELTWPAVKPNILGVPALLADWLTTTVGSQLWVTGHPSPLAPETIKQIIEGSSETYGSVLVDVTAILSPASPYAVAVEGDDILGKADTDGSVLVAPVTSGATTMLVATTTGTSPLWTTDAGEMPLPLLVAGEVVSVTAVAAPTVITFGAAGTAAHASNASVTPGIPASVATGNLLLVLAAIRNSGTGLPVVPSGYERIPAFPADSNVQLFGKVATSSGEVAPTITFTAGVANADTSAQMCRVAGAFSSPTEAFVVSNAQLNASAQDIAYPAINLVVPNVNLDNCLVLHIGWKADDWTSVATIASSTEIGEPDTTTGDDQGLVWDYRIQTTAADIAAGTFVVTGGASAISRGAVCAIRSNVQSMTVTRAVNGVAKAQAARADIRLTPGAVAAY